MNDFQKSHDEVMAALKPGAKIIWKNGDEERAQTITSVRYQSAVYEIWPDLTWWQRITRRLTPARWRKPLEPVRTYQPAGWTMTTEPFWLTQMRETVDRLTEEPPQ